MANPDKFNKPDAASDYSRKQHNKEVLDAAKAAPGPRGRQNGYEAAVHGLRRP